MGVRDWQGDPRVAAVVVQTTRRAQQQLLQGAIANQAVRTARLFTQYTP